MSDAKSRLMAYVRGWSDGTGIRAMRPEFTSHATLAEAYNEGYSAGVLARGRATEAAQVKFGVDLSILRTPEPIRASDVAMVAFDVAAQDE